MYKKILVVVAGLCLFSISSCTEDDADPVVSGAGGGGGGAGVAGSTAGTQDNNGTPSSGGTGGTDSTPTGGDGGNGTDPDPSLRAVIVKAAGPLPGQSPESHPDAITSATIEPYNTHVFVDVLAEKLIALGVTTEIVNHFDCESMSCVVQGSEIADIVVLASPTQGFKMLNQITSLVPSLGNLAPPPSVCSGLTSCGAGPAVEPLVRQMTELGLNTIAGVALRANGDMPGGEPVVTDEVMHSRLETFADDLVAALP